jgi:hypothetical protein
MYSRTSADCKDWFFGWSCPGERHFGFQSPIGRPAYCRLVMSPTAAGHEFWACAFCLLTVHFLTTIPSFSEGDAVFFPTSASSGRTPLGRGSDGRFGLRRFRAKLTPTPFGTHRAFTHALPPSFGLRSVPFTVPPCFFPLPLK